MASPGTHGGSVETPIEAALSDDPELALAWADMAAWHEAHPCECEALCECEQREA
jgi:hypothetical protein